MSSFLRLFVGFVVTLFVYGTLMRDGPRHGLLADQRFLGEARTRPYYALFDLGEYPGLVHRPEEGRAIHGELYEVPASLIERLDRIEDAPSLFRLESILIADNPREVIAYFYQRDTVVFPLCEGDCWVNKGFPG